MAFGLDLGNLLVHLKLDSAQYKKMIGDVERGLENTAKKFNTVGKRMSLFVTAPIVAAGTLAAKSFAKFDDAMVSSLAIMGNVGAGLRREMRQTAIVTSMQTVTSAEDLAKSYYYLASAGLTAEQSVKALGAVERFAVAGAFDMKMATDLATDAQSALGLKIADSTQNMINLTRVTDVLTKANTLANASSQQFAEALTTKSASALRILNKDVEEGVAVLAAFADQGIKGSLAGEKLHIVLRDLQRASLANVKAWELQGLSVYDSTGAMLNIADVISQLEARLGGMSSKQKKATLTMLGFQDRSVSAIQTLLGTSDAIRKYEEQLRSAAGVTKDVAEKQLMSFGNQMRIVWNQVKAMAIGIGELLAPTILKLNEIVKDSIAWWDGLGKGTKEFIIAVMGLAASIGPLLIGLSSLIIGVIALKAILKPLFILIGANGIVFIALALGVKKVVDDFIKVETNIIRLNGYIRKINDTLKEHKKLWGDLREELKATAEGRIIAAQVDVIQRQLEQKTEQLKILKEQYEAFSWFGKWMEGQEYDAFTKGLQNEIDVLAKRLSSLDEGAKSIIKTAEKAAASTKGLIDDSMGAGIPPNIQEMLDALDFEYEMLGKINEARERAISLARFKKAIEDEYGVSIAGNVSKINAQTVGWEKLSESQQIAITLYNQYREKLDKVAEGKTGIVALKVKFEELGDSVSNTGANLGDVMVSAFNRTSQALTDLVINGKADFAELAKSILADLTQMIIKQMLFNVLAGALGITPAPVAGVAPGTPTVGATVKHKGGVIGQINNERKVAAGLFANAPRFHNGLQADEYPAILQRGESVVARKDADKYNQFTKGNNSEQIQPKVNLRVINVMDKNQMLDALGTSEGEVAIVNAIKRNKGTISGVLR